MMLCRLFTFASVVSLLLCVTAVALWASQFEWHWILKDDPAGASVFMIDHNSIGLWTQRYLDLAEINRSMPFWLLTTACSILPIIWYLHATPKQRLGRRLFTIAAAVSLLCCFAAVLLWASNGGLWITWNAPLPVKIDRSHYHFTDGDWGSARFLIFRFVEYLGFVPERWVVVPGWLLVLVSAPLPILWGLNRMRNSSHGTSPDACPNCSYNLTGNTSGVCPECGTPIPRKPAERA